MKEGMETKAVVITMMIRSSTVFLRSAAKEPRMMPRTVAHAAAIRPSLALVLRPSPMMSMTMRPRSFREGPNRSCTTSVR